MPFAYLPRSAILLGLRRPGFGHLRTQADAVARTFKRRLRLDNGPSRADDVGRVVGHCRHSGGLGSMSPSASVFAIRAAAVFAGVPTPCLRTVR